MEGNKIPSRDFSVMVLAAVFGYTLAGAVLGGERLSQILLILMIVLPIPIQFLIIRHRYIHTLGCLLNLTDGKKAPWYLWPLILFFWLMHVFGQFYTVLGRWLDFKLLDYMLRQDSEVMFHSLIHDGWFESLVYIQGCVAATEAE